MLYPRSCVQISTVHTFVHSILYRATMFVYRRALRATRMPTVWLPTRTSHRPRCINVSVIMAMREMVPAVHQCAGRLTVIVRLRGPRTITARACVYVTRIMCQLVRVSHRTTIANARLRRLCSGWGNSVSVCHRVAASMIRTATSAHSRTVRSSVCRWPTHSIHLVHARATTDSRVAGSSRVSVLRETSSISLMRSPVRSVWRLANAPPIRAAVAGARRVKF